MGLSDDLWRLILWWINWSQGPRELCVKQKVSRAWKRVLLAERFLVGEFFDQCTGTIDPRFLAHRTTHLAWLLDQPNTSSESQTIYVSDLEVVPFERKTIPHQQIDLVDSNPPRKNCLSVHYFDLDALYHDLWEFDMPGFLKFTFRNFCYVLPVMYLWRLCRHEHQFRFPLHDQYEFVSLFSLKPVISLPATSVIVKFADCLRLVCHFQDHPLRPTIAMILFNHDVLITRFQVPGPLPVPRAIPPSWAPHLPTPKFEFPPNSGLIGDSFLPGFCFDLFGSSSLPVQVLTELPFTLTRIHPLTQQQVHRTFTEHCSFDNLKNQLQPLFLGETDLSSVHSIFLLAAPIPGVFAAVLVLFSQTYGVLLQRKTHFRIYLRSSISTHKIPPKTGEETSYLLPFWLVNEILMVCFYSKAHQLIAFQLVHVHERQNN